MSHKPVILEMVVCVIENYMSVRSTESERVDRGSAKTFRRPWCSCERELVSLLANLIRRKTFRLLYLDSEELRVNLRVRTFEICVWWYHSSLENQDRFDYACNTTRTFQMSNVAFDSTTILTSVTIVKHVLKRAGTLDGLVECHEKVTYTYKGSSGLRTILNADPRA